MTRILRVIATADPSYGGPLEGALRTGEVWAQRGHRQDLMTLDPPGSGFQPNYPGTIFELGRRRTRTPWGRYRYAPGAADWLRRHARDYDAVIVAGLWSYATMVARRVLVAGETPYFVFIHGMLDPWFRATYPLKHLAKQGLWLVNEGPLLHGAAGVLFTTREERRVSKHQFWPDRIVGEVVQYGTADAPDEPQAQAGAFAARCPALAGRRFLLFLSRIHRKKGCDLLIDAYARSTARADGVALAIAGPDEGGTLAGLQAQVATLGLERAVHFPGMLQGPAKWGAFRAAEAFVLTSHQENFGVVVAEAMACAKPVLISDKVQLCDEVVETGSGLVEPDTAAGALRLLDRFAAMDAGARAAMAAAARRTFVARYDIHAAADALMHLIERRIGGR